MALSHYGQEENIGHLSCCTGSIINNVGCQEYNSATTEPFQFQRPVFLLFGPILDEQQEKILVGEMKLLLLYKNTAKSI